MIASLIARVSSSKMGKDKKDNGSGAAGTSNNVYIMDKELAWIPARLLSQDKDEAVVSVPTYDDEPSILSDGGKNARSWTERKVKLKNYPGKILPMQNVDKGGVLVEKEDMVDLPYLHEVRMFCCCCCFAVILAVIQ